MVLQWRPWVGPLEHSAEYSAEYSAELVHKSNLITNFFTFVARQTQQYNAEYSADKHTRDSVRITA
jgi:hypothetical protein